MDINSETVNKESILNIRNSDKHDVNINFESFELLKNDEKSLLKNIAEFFLKNGNVASDNLKKKIAQEIKREEYTIYNNDSYEHITDPQNIRFFAKPIDPKYQKIMDLYNKQEETFWTAKEIKYTSQDVDDFNSLKSEEQFFLKQVLAFFASSDNIVNFNLSERFLQEFTPNEIKTAYVYQMMMENIHSQVYSDLIDNIIKNPEEKTKLLNAFQESGPVKKMMDWAMKWIHSNDTIGTRIIAFTIIESVFFSGMFASIFWLKKQRSNGKLFLESIIKSNRFISRDEGLHVEFACELYKHIINKVPQNIVHNIMREANFINEEFMNDAIKCDMIGMNQKLMTQYINYVSDRLLLMLGYEKIYNVQNPFGFMDTIALHNKDNFFENRPDSYQSAFNEKNKNDNEFKILEEF
jgi:ribonucleotide reductase beta subunit family protein with ferritin-like domain